MLLLGLEEVDCAVPLEAIVTAHFHLIADVVHVEVCGEGIGDAVDSVLDHEPFLLLDVLLVVILRHRSSHVVAHQVHLIELLHVPASLLHLQQCERSEAGSSLPVAVANIGDIPAHLTSLPMRSWCSLLLFHKLSDMGVVPDSHMLIILECFLELMDQQIMVEHCYKILINSSNIFEIGADINQSSRLSLKYGGVAVQLCHKTLSADVLAFTPRPNLQNRQENACKAKKKRDSEYFVSILQACKRCTILRLLELAEFGMDFSIKTFNVAVFFRFDFLDGHRDSLSRSNNNRSQL